MIVVGMSPSSTGHVTIVHGACHHRSRGMSPSFTGHVTIVHGACHHRPRGMSPPHRSRGMSPSFTGHVTTVHGACHHRSRGMSPPSTGHVTIVHGAPSVSSHLVSHSQFVKTKAIFDIIQFEVTTTEWLPAEVGPYNQWVGLATVYNQGSSTITDSHTHNTASHFTTVIQTSHCVYKSVDCRFHNFCHITVKQYPACYGHWIPRSATIVSA